MPPLRFKLHRVRLLAVTAVCGATCAVAQQPNVPPAVYHEAAANQPARVTPPAERRVVVPMQFTEGNGSTTGSPVRRASHHEPLPNNHSVAGKRPLSPPKPSGAPQLSRRGIENDSAKPKPSTSGSIVTVISSLAVVLGMFFLAAWLMRRGAPKGSGRLPGEVVEVLGRAPLIGRQQLHVLRFGGKLVLVSLGSGDIETISEITDPEEVDRLAGLCQQTRKDSATKAFRQVFQQLGRHKAAHESLSPKTHNGFRPTSFDDNDAPKPSGTWEGVDA